MLCNIFTHVEFKFTPTGSLVRSATREWTSLPPSLMHGKSMSYENEIHTGCIAEASTLTFLPPFPIERTTTGREMQNGQNIWKEDPLSLFFWMCNEHISQSVTMGADFPRKYTTLGGQKIWSPEWNFCRWSTLLVSAFRYSVLQLKHVLNFDTRFWLSCQVLYFLKRVVTNLSSDLWSIYIENCSGFWRDHMTLPSPTMKNILVSRPRSKN